MSQAKNVTFHFRQRKNCVQRSFFHILHTVAGNVRAEYVPGSECFDHSRGTWKYTFRYLCVDLPSSLSPESFTQDVLQPPHISPVIPNFISDSSTIKWSGAGTQNNPLKASIVVSDKKGNMMDEQCGIFVGPPDCEMIPNLICEKTISAAKLKGGKEGYIAVSGPNGCVMWVDPCAAIASCSPTTDPGNPDPPTEQQTEDHFTKEGELQVTIPEWATCYMPFGWGPGGILRGGGGAYGQSLYAIGEDEFVQAGSTLVLKAGEKAQSNTVGSTFSGVFKGVVADSQAIIVVPGGGNGGNGFDGGSSNFPDNGRGGNVGDTNGTRFVGTAGLVTGCNQYGCQIYGAGGGGWEGGVRQSGGSFYFMIGNKIANVEIDGNPGPNGEAVNQGSEFYEQGIGGAEQDGAAGVRFYAIPPA